MKIGFPRARASSVFGILPSPLHLMGYIVVCEGIKGEGKCLFPSPFKSFVYYKYLVISVLRVKVVLFNGEF